MKPTPQKMRFAAMLRDYLRSTDMKQCDLAEQLGISNSAISQILHGRIAPKHEHLDRICELLALDRAQAQELRSSLMKIKAGAEELRSVFNDTFFTLRCQRGISRQQLANLSGVPLPHIEVFESSFDAVPTFDEAEKIARVLECSTESLLCAAGVGGFFQDNPAQFAHGDSQLGDSGAVYRVTRQAPLTLLCDLTGYDGAGSLVEFISRKGKFIEVHADLPENIAAVSISGRELSLGIPGAVTLIVADRHPENYREVFFARTFDGKYFLYEQRADKRREFRLSGTTRPLPDNLQWSVPVVELSLRPVGVSRKKSV